MSLGIVPKLGWRRPGPGRPPPQIFSFAIRASGSVYGFVAEIAVEKLARSGLSGQQIAGQARDHAMEVMRSRQHDPEHIHATEPRQLHWEADSAKFRYCQFFDFGPDGGSVLYLNRPPPGETDRLAESAFSAETPSNSADKTATLTGSFGRVIDDLQTGRNRRCAAIEIKRE